MFSPPPPPKQNSVCASFVFLVVCRFINDKSFQPTTNFNPKMAHGKPKQIALSTVFMKTDKSVPLQARSGPEGSRKLRFPVFKTTAQRDGKFVSIKHRPHLPAGNSPGTHFC